MTKLQEYYVKLKKPVIEKRMIEANVPQRFRDSRDVDDCLPKVFVDWLDGMLKNEAFLNDDCVSYMLQSAPSNNAHCMPALAAVLVRCDLAAFYTPGVTLARALVTETDAAADFVETCRAADILIIDYCFVQHIWNDFTGMQRNYVTEFAQEHIQHGGIIITQGGPIPVEFNPSVIYLQGLVNSYFETI